GGGGWGRGGGSSGGKSGRSSRATLFGRRAGLDAQRVSPRNPASKDFLQGKVEVLLTRRLAPLEWQALVRPGRKIGVGERITFGEKNELQAEVVSRGEFGERTLRFTRVPGFFSAVGKIRPRAPPPLIAPVSPPQRPRAPPT